MTRMQRNILRAAEYSEYRNPRAHWHPAFSRFDPDNSNTKTFARSAIREGEELRAKLKGKRILVATK